jgi:hypothetical protein
MKLEILMKKLLILSLALAASTAFAKLPATSDEAKAKAAEGAAKTAHAGKMDAYLLCKSQDKVAAKMKKSKEKVTTPPCADPGKFVYPPPAAPAAPVAAAPAKK